MPRSKFTLRLCIGAFLTLTLTPCVSAFASPTPQEQELPIRLTLDLAREILLISNPDLLAARQKIAAARADAVSAGQLPNPVFSYTAENVGGSSASDVSFWNDQDMNLTVEQRIPVGGRRARLEGVAEQAVAVAHAAVQDTVRRLVLELETRYFDVVLAEQALELAYEILGQFDQVVALMEHRYDQGEASGLDLARLRTERLRFDNDRIEAETAVANAKLALQRLLGAVPAEGIAFEVEDVLSFESAPIDPDALEAEALANRPDLAEQRSRLEQARRGHEYERALRAPDLVPYLGYNRDFGRNNVTFGLSVAIPIFNRNQGGIARAVAKIEEERNLLASRELAVRSEVRQASNLVAARAELVELMRTRYVPSAERARDIAQASYTLGALDLIAFLDAERAYRETLRGYYQALYDHHIARFVLDAVVGGGGA